MADPELARYLRPVRRHGCVKEYIANDSVKRPVLELALQKYEQLSIVRRRVADEQRRADGQL